MGQRRCLDRFNRAVLHPLRMVKHGIHSKANRPPPAKWRWILVFAIPNARHASVDHNAFRRMLLHLLIVNIMGTNDPGIRPYSLLPR
jgi:hypothetical protein